jgi:4-amino-4-deoxy-L-arabinose transferase-like glycosyltransferase
LVALALILRAARLDLQPLWWDEGYSVWFAHHPLPEMLRLTAQDIHPPLYYALLGGWSQLFGLAPVALRLLSVMVGVLAIPLAYAVGRWLGGRRAGLLAAMLFTISPLAIYYSQEIRMYALVALWALAAVGAAARWLGLGREERERREKKETTERGARRFGWGWLAAYIVAMTLALYTQYYAAFLLIGLATAGVWVLWRQRAPLGRFGWWIGAQVTVGLLYLPWLRYATPKLVAYVAQKVVADSDRPLGLLAYLARHLAAYNAGHTEGPLTSWWFLGLIGLLPLAWAFWRLRTRRNRHAANDQLAIDHWQLTIGNSLGFLLITLAIILTIGWLVNLTLPFFPERGERLLLLGLPVYLLLVAVAIASATRRASAPAPTTSAPPANRPHPPSFHRFLPFLLVLPFLFLAALSLAAFYTIPRYADEDYRPLIGQVTQWGRPEDTVFAVFPWQVGYFWSYGQPDGPQPVLSPDEGWTPAVAQTLEAALAAGHVWFPEHLSLGGILESAAEQHLASSAYHLANRWYSSSTRLTGWAAPRRDQPWTAAAPVAFSNGMILRAAQYGPPLLTAANTTLLLELAWDASAAGASPHVSVRLASADGRTWAQQDYTPGTNVGPERIGLLVPAGTPPGVYDLLLSVRPAAEAAPWDVVGPDGHSQGVETNLGQVQVVVPATAPATATLPIGQPLAADLGDAVRLLGFSATEGPLAPGDDLVVSLFWQALPDMATVTGDLFAFMQLLDDADRVQAGWEGPPVAWHPTRAWQQDELVRSQHILRLPATLADGRYRLIAGLFDPATGQRLESRDSLLRPSSDAILLDQVEVVGREHIMNASQPQYPLQADLARLGRLVGFDLSATDVAPGGQIDLTLHWQATETTGDRLSIFVHLLDAQGAFLAQADDEPGDGALPTASWLPGEYLADPHVLTVRPDAPAGPASLVVGLYDPRSGQRVSWLDADGQPVGDQLVLPVQIAVSG